MSELYDLVFIPFAWVLRSLYFFFNSYGMAIIVFCLITKIVLFPLSLKGKKSMIKMNALSSRQQQLQKQYGKDKARLNAEIQKLYDKEKVNPMGGCLWSMLPLPILMGLYGVIRRPLHYLMGLTSDEVNELSNFLFGKVISSSGTGEITIAEELFHHFQAAVSGLPAVAEKLFSLDFKFLGINLAATPQWNPTQFDSLSWGNIGLFLIPLVSAVLAFFTMQISMKTNGAGNNKDNPIANNKSMMLMMPMISLWIGFTLPAALGIYWIANNVFTMLQEILAGKMLAKDYAKAAAERAEHEQQEREEEKGKKREALEAKAKAVAEGKKRLQAERKESGEVLVNSRVGIRAYARGRNYDPTRYGSVTTYRDPAASVDEATVNAVLEAKAVQESEENIETNVEAAAAAVVATETIIPAETLPEAAKEASPVVSASTAAPAEKDSSDNEDYEAEAEKPEEDEE